jgi:ribonuclease P protein component
MNLGLVKSDRLKSRKLIEQLFAEGKTIKSYPIILVYSRLENEAEKPPLQITVSVSKRKFKRAVDRNRIKRQLREAYRTQKNIFLDGYHGNKRYIAMFIYVSNEHLDSSQIDFKIKALLTRLSDSI